MKGGQNWGVFCQKMFSFFSIFVHSTAQGWSVNDFLMCKRKFTPLSITPSSIKIFHGKLNMQHTLMWDRKSCKALIIFMSDFVLYRDLNSLFNNSTWGNLLKIDQKLQWFHRRNHIFNRRFTIMKWNYLWDNLIL